jgi:lipopolysaccharide/colanic/teichoic acid biosynthesis glycosyltransferase
MLSFYAKTGKRVLDVAVSAIGLIILSPLLVFVSLAVKLTSRGPAIFRQIRVGQFEMPFFILKFRSMRDGPQAKGSLLTAAGDPRITALGYLLRKTKIDELPQLWNVLRGDMSLVGPRPEVPNYTSQYTQRQRQVFFAKPGITSPKINFDEELLLATRTDKDEFYVSEILPAKLEIDLGYCQNIRFFTDMNILISTVGKLLVHPFGSLRSVRSSPKAPRITSSPEA